MTSPTRNTPQQDAVNHSHASFNSLYGGDVSYDAWLALRNAGQVAGLKWSLLKNVLLKVDTGNDTRAVVWQSGPNYDGPWTTVFSGNVAGDTEVPGEAMGAVNVNGSIYFRIAAAGISLSGVSQTNAVVTQVSLEADVLILKYTPVGGLEPSDGVPTITGELIAKAVTD